MSKQATETLRNQACVLMPTNGLENALLWGLCNQCVLMCSADLSFKQLYLQNMQDREAGWKFPDQLMKGFPVKTRP